MHSARVGDEVLSRPRIASEEFSRQQVSLETIARGTRQHDVAHCVSAAVGEWMHVVQRGEVELEHRAAVHAPAAAITHGCSLERSLLMSGGDLLDSAADAWRSWEGDTVEMPTSGQFHLAKKGRPVAGRLPRQGVAPIAKKAGPETIWVAAVVIAAGDILDVERVVGSSASGGTREKTPRAIYRCIHPSDRARAGIVTFCYRTSPWLTGSSRRSSPCAPSCAPVSSASDAHSAVARAGRTRPLAFRAESANTGTGIDRSCCSA